MWTSIQNELALLSSMSGVLEQRPAGCIQPTQDSRANRGMHAAHPEVPISPRKYTRIDIGSGSSKPLLGFASRFFLWMIVWPATGFEPTKISIWRERPASCGSLLPQLATLSFIIMELP